MNLLTQILICCRRRMGLTQQDLAAKLSAYETVFGRLNGVTISRWETGETIPSIAKKRYLLHFLLDTSCFNESKECGALIRSAYTDMRDSLSHLFSARYQYLIGNLPLPDHANISAQSIHALPNKKEHIEHIIDIEVATNATNYYRLTAENLAEWCGHPSNFCMVCERKKQHLGHFVMLKIKNSVAEEIAHHRRDEFSLQKRDFCKIHEPGTYYIHALYGRSPKIAALLNIQAYLHLFENIQYTDNIMIFSSRSDGRLLTQDYGIDVVAEGNDETFGFHWYGMMSPARDILFSNTVIKLIF